MAHTPPGDASAHRSVRVTEAWDHDSRVSLVKRSPRGCVEENCEARPRGIVSEALGQLREERAGRLQVRSLEPFGEPATQAVQHHSGLAGTAVLGQ
jgi:hypothetical protein